MNNNIHFLFGDLGNVDCNINHNIYKLFLTFYPIYYCHRVSCGPYKIKRQLIP